MELVIVENISSTGAICRTSYNAEINVSWANDLPNPIPKVGERWSVSKVDFSEWKFDSKIRNGKYDVMRYAIELDARTCIGKERGIIDDIAQIGVDEVFLKVASDSIVLWNSKVAEGLGLSCFGDHVSQLVTRLRDYDIAVTFVIDCRLWSDTSSGSKQHQYQQRYYVSENEMAYSQYMSFRGAKVAVKALVDELYERYGEYARGVCFTNFRIANEAADFSFSMVAEYMRRFGEEPGYQLVEKRSGNAWWESHFKWMEFQSTIQSEFVKELKKNIGAWPISCIVDSSLFCAQGSRTRSGRLPTGISDDFSTYGWEFVGFPLDYTKQSDEAAELRSLEYLIACEQRFSKGCGAIYPLGIDGLSQPLGAFEMLSKYGATTVLLEDYEVWRRMSDQQVIEIKEAMDRYKVVEHSELDYVGILLSNDSKDIACYQTEENDEFSKALENLCAILLDKLPHKLKIYFDEDVEVLSKINETAALILYMASNMTDKAVTTIETMLEDESKGVCIVGRAGYMEGETETERAYPFVTYFDQANFLIQEYVQGLEVGPGEIDVTSSGFSLNSTNVGILPVLEAGNSESFIQVVSDGKLKNKEAKAPLFFKDRSSMLGMDVLRDESLLHVAGELALYAVGRNH